MNWITPPQLHMHLQVMLSAGTLAIMTVGEPGIHGAIVIGMQGIGVSTPNAAVVAAATMGLAMDMHMTNGGMLAIGLWSMMVPAGGPPAIVVGACNALNTLGATPNEHIIMVPVFAMGGMAETVALRQVESRLHRGRRDLLIHCRPAATTRLVTGKPSSWRKVASRTHSTCTPARCKHAAAYAGWCR